MELDHLQAGDCEANAEKTDEWETIDLRPCKNQSVECTSGFDLEQPRKSRS